jgi:hypothetical protein
LLGLAWNYHPPDLFFLNSWDYRLESLVTGLKM